MKAINQRLIIYDPFSCFFPPSWWKRIRVKALLGDIPLLKHRLKEQAAHQPNHGNPVLLPCNHREGRGILRGGKGSSELFLCIPFISGAIITRETSKLKPSFHTTSRPTLHFLFYPDSVFTWAVSGKLWLIWPLSDGSMYPMLTPAAHPTPWPPHSFGV